MCLWKLKSCLAHEKQILGNPNPPDVSKKRSSETETDGDLGESDTEIAPSVKRSVPMSFEDSIMETMESLKSNEALEARRLTLEEKRLEFEKEKWQQQLSDTRAEMEMRKEENDMRNKLMMAMIEKLGK